MNQEQCLELLIICVCVCVCVQECLYCSVFSIENNTMTKASGRQSDRHTETHIQTFTKERGRGNQIRYKYGFE
jgi:hypothetical protein